MRQASIHQGLRSAHKTMPVKTSPPSEAELIELENFVMYRFECLTEQSPAYTRNDRVLETMKRLVEMARESR